MNLKKIELHKGFDKVANNLVTHSADFQGCSRKLWTCDLVTVGNISRDKVSNWHAHAIDVSIRRLTLAVVRRKVRVLSEIRQLIK